MSTTSLKTCIEIKTPNCPRCKMFESTYHDLQLKFPQFDYKVYTFGIDAEAQEFYTKYNIHSAPTFIVMNGENVDVVKQEELGEVLERNAD